MEQLSYGDELRELGVFRLQKRRLCRDLREPSSARQGLRRKMGTDFLAGLLRVDVRKVFDTVRMVKHWNRFPEKVFLISLGPMV